MLKDRSWLADLITEKIVFFLFGVKTIKVMKAIKRNKTKNNMEPDWCTNLEQETSMIITHNNKFFFLMPVHCRPWQNSVLVCWSNAKASFILVMADSNVWFFYFLFEFYPLKSQNYKIISKNERQVSFSIISFGSDLKFQNKKK